MINSLKFYTVYEKKFISCVTLLPDQISLTGCLYFVRYWAVLGCNCKPGCDVYIHFEINLFNHAVFSTWPKSQDENLNVLRTKSALKMKQNIFHQGLSLKQIKTSDLS